VTAVKEFVVDSRNSGKKVFKFIQDAIPGLGNTEIFKLIRKEIIKINGKKEDSGYVLKEGDRIKVFMKDEHFDGKGKRSDDKFRSVRSSIDVVFEDRDVLVVNKEAGLLVHPDRKEYKNVLSEMVKSYLYKKGEYKSGSYFSPSPCHRIDSNTSGLVVFAKNHESLKRITGEFRRRSTRKIYLGLIFGKLTGSLFLSSYIDASENRENKVAVSEFKKLNMIPDKDGFIAENSELSATLVNPVRSIANCTLAEIEIWTGKKHQIRVHLKECGNPLLGDNKYFLPASMSLSQMFGIKNYFLHCHKITIGGYPEWTADIPANFKNAVFEIMKFEI
jgi:23S rRNA pseudouridine955/2504/2580 synthase